MADVYLNNNIGSYHWDRKAVKEKNFREVNPGIGLEYDSDKLRAMIGRYLNSEGNNSNYALMGYTPLQSGNFKAGLFGGAVSGYDMPITPAAGLLGSYKKGRLGVNLILTPQAKIGGKKVYGFAGLQAKYKLNK